MKTVFWDFDGTLVYSVSWAKIIRKVLADFGYQVPLEEIRPRLRTCYSWNTPERTYENRLEQWWPDLFAHYCRLFQELDVNPSLFPTLNATIRRRILDPAVHRLYEDALPVLAACRKAGYQSYILSNNYPELETVIAALGLEPYFSGCVVSARLGYEKPHPALFQAALDLAGRPETAYMVGDNPNADIRGGNTAGMTTILVHCEQPSEAAYVCQSLTEVSAVLGIR